MKRKVLGLFVGVCSAAAILGTAAPALAGSGNTATNSTGAVQVGSVSCEPDRDRHVVEHQRERGGTDRSAGGERREQLGVRLDRRRAGVAAGRGSQCQRRRREHHGNSRLAGFA